MSDQPPYPPEQSYPAPPPYGGGESSPRKPGFFGALFDFRFEHFVTPTIVRVVYVVATVVLVLGWLVFTVVSFAQNGAGGGLAVLVLGALGVLIYLCLIRMTFEFYLALVRLSEDVHHRLPRS